MSDYKVDIDQGRIIIPIDSKLFKLTKEKWPTEWKDLHCLRGIKFTLRVDHDQLIITGTKYKGGFTLACRSAIEYHSLVSRIQYRHDHPDYKVDDTSDIDIASLFFGL